MEYKSNSLIKEESISEFDKYLNGNNGISPEIEYISPTSISQKSSKRNPVPNVPKAIPLVIFEDGKFQIPQEAYDLLTQNDYSKIGIISLVGKYRTGKSFLLNRVILNTHKKSGFNVAPTFKPCTKGIWIWSEPLIINNKNCPYKFPCFLVDTEGLGAYVEEINHDSKIFIIAILISSLFIYNSFGAIDETAINTLSFVLNLSKLIKIKSLSHEDKEEELAEYFPSFLWLLRDFSLKLENMEGKEITEKEYLESALENKIGNSEMLDEKNKVRNLIKAYFPERDCFTMVRPVEKEEELQNLQNLPDDMLRKEFLIQAQNFRNKVYELALPKSFHKRALNGSMLIELIQNILDSINSGAIPVIENTWKYVVQSECIKNTQNLTDKFYEEIKNFRDLNKNDKNFGKNVKNYTKNLYKKYINDFLNNDLIDEENKKEFVEKLKKNLDNKLDLFEKENEEIFKDKFESALNELSNNFLQDLSKQSDNNKYFDFFFEFDNLIQKAKQLCPDFPQKNDIIYDKVVEILRKYVEENINLKNKKKEEEFNLLKKENEEQKKLINELNLKSERSQNEKKDEEIEIKNKINEIKLKIRKTEQLIDDMKNNKNQEEEHYNKEMVNIRNKYELQIREILNSKKEKSSEINLKSEQLKIMKKNYDKLMELHQKKIDYYETEIKKLREKYDILLKQAENSEIKANNSRKSSMSENPKNNKNNNIILSNDLNDFMGYIQDNLIKQNEDNKLMMSKIIQDKEKDCENEKELYSNYKYLKKVNEDLNIKINANENKINLLQKELNELKEYKNIIKTMKYFKCKNCSKNYSFNDFIHHIKHCQNYLNINDSKEKNILNFNPNKLNIKIINAKIKQDELNQPYIEYIIEINYDNKKKYQIHKQFYHFSNLYNNLVNLYQESIQLPLSFENIFQNFNSDSFMNKDKTQILEKFINEVAHTDVINNSKSFLKFIEFEKYFKKSNKSSNKNKIDIRPKEDNNFIFKGNISNKKNYNEDDNEQIKENIVNNRYINRLDINKKMSKTERTNYNKYIKEDKINYMSEKNE